jgi:hypothetical protein
MSVSFERRLRQLEQQIGCCPYCRDEPVITLIAPDLKTDEDIITREDPPCSHCGSPNSRITIRIVHDDTRGRLS